MNNTGNHPLVLGLDGDDIAAVTLRNGGVLNDVLVLAGKKRLSNLTVQSFPGIGQFPAHPGQFR